MKKTKLFLLTLLSLFLGGVNAAWADYTVDFNTAIAVPSNNHTDPMFQVSTGWTRIADRKNGDGYYGTSGYYMRYTYYTDAGVDGTGTLLANAQQAPQSSYDGTIETVHDYIVTPKVSGTITLQVKGSTSASNTLPSFINFYAVDDDATTIGDEITANYSAELNTDDFVTVTLTPSAATRIAIRAQWVYMDNFTATSAEVPDVTALTVTNVMNMDGQTGFSGTNPAFEQQPDGTLLVKLKVAIQNTGNVVLAAGTTENYTLTLASANGQSATKTYYEAAPIAITEDLAAGESTTIDVEVNVNYTDTYSAYRYWFVRENVSGTTSSTFRYATSVAYESKFVLREAGSTSTSDLTGTQNYGKISEATTKGYEIYNDGTGPLTIKSITLPVGFTCGNLPAIPADGLVVEKKTATSSFDITLPMDNTGVISGDLVIVYTDAAGEEQTKTVAFTGTVLAAGQWFADFDVASSSETNYPEGSVAESGIRYGTTYISSGNYDGYLYSYTSSSYAAANNKFITPKLHAAAGDKLAFDVRRDDSSSSSYNLKVYVSADRVNWGEPVFSETAANLTINFQTQEITFDTEGDYYVAFAIYGVRIDNLVGLTKVDVAHDLYIKSVSWPDASIKSGTAQSKPSVDIIPLTTETADNYTVKYVCGESVLAEGTPVALTASANSSKPISFSWTPSVESTTVYEGTKVVFEFTDGTKFETETFDLTVTNEPIFHFLNSKQTSRWYEPTSDYTTPYNFGKTNVAGASKTFWILNWGSAPLTVKSIAVPEGFTTSVSSMTLPAFDGTQDGLETCQQSFDVTFTATEAGTYNGNLVVTYVNAAGEDATYELPISGTMLDPTLWYANFNDQAWPAGSVYQDNVSVSYINTGDYGLLSSSSTKNLFFTPKLTAAAGDVLQFDASTRNSYYDGTVKLYVATDRENLGDAVKEIELSKTDNVSKSTYEYTFDAAGDYYVAFALSEARVDDIYGLKLAEVKHDWALVSSNIPTEAMQNYTSTATVNILNLGIKDEAAEDITVTAYVDGEAVATAEGVAIPMSHKLTDAGTQLSISYIVNEAGTFPVYLEVKAGEYSVATEPVNVVFAAEEAKTEADMAVNGTTGDVPLNLNYHNSESVTMYNADALAAAGISAGTKIKKITYKGFKTTDVQTTSFQVYYKWTDDQTLAQPANTYPYAAADNGMTKLIDEDHTWAKVGSSSELGEMIVLDFTESPLTYEEGKSLVIYMHSYVNSYKAAYFEKSTISNDYCYERQQDNTSISNLWNKKNPAALHFTLETSVATFAGSVMTTDGDPIANADVTLAADNGVKYSGKTGNDGAYSINVIQTGLSYNVTATNGEVSATGRNVSLADGNVTKNFVLGTISLGDVPEPAIYAKVVLNRALKRGWNAVVLPFAVSAEELATVCGGDDGIELAEYYGDEGDTEVIVTFKDVKAVEANVPFLLYLPSEDRENPEFANVDLAADEAVTEGDVFDFVGVYDRTDVNAGDYFIQGGKFVKASTGNYVLPYRSYLKLKDTAAGARSIRFVIGDNQVVTAINGLTIDATSTEGAYNLQGQKVEQLKKGNLYIINGKKVLVK